MELITDAHFWVGAAFVVFLVILVVAGVHKFAWKALGDAGEKVRAQLDEANRLREEAQALLARIQSER
nr:F-type H+-transporting ATPase subunit b [Phenylobacterium sp.]